MAVKYMLIALANVLITKSAVYASAEEERLIKHLLTNYSSLIQPIHAKLQEIVSVNVSVQLLQILEVEEPREELSTVIHLTMEWKDPRLRWTSNNFGMIEDMTVPITALWIPELTLYNSMDLSRSFKIGTPNDDGDQHFFATIHSNGQVTVALPVILKSICKMEISEYPFDNQLCQLQLGSWTLGQNELVLNPQKTMHAKDYVANQAWQLRDSFCTSSLAPIPSNSGVIGTSIECFIKLRRTSVFELVYYTIPPILIAVLSVLVFLVPPEVGKRMECGITLIMCLAVYLSLVNKKMPSTSEAFPLVSKFYGCVIVELTVAMVCSCYCLHIYDPEGLRLFRLPKYLRVLAIGILSKIVCYNTSGSPNSVAPADAETEQRLCSKNSQNARQRWKKIGDLQGINRPECGFGDEEIRLSKPSEREMLPLELIPQTLGSTHSSETHNTSEDTFRRRDSGFAETDSNDDRPTLSTWDSSISNQSLTSDPNSVREISLQLGCHNPSPVDSKECREEANLNKNAGAKDKTSADDSSGTQLEGISTEASLRDKISKYDKLRSAARKSRNQRIMQETIEAKVRRLMGDSSVVSKDFNYSVQQPIARTSFSQSRKQEKEDSSGGFGTPRRSSLTQTSPATRIMMKQTTRTIVQVNSGADGNRSLNVLKHNPITESLRQIFGRIKVHRTNPIVPLAKTLERERKRTALRTQWMNSAMILNRFFTILLSFSIFIAFLAVFLQSSRFSNGGE